MNIFTLYSSASIPNTLDHSVVVTERKQTAEAQNVPEYTSLGPTNSLGVLLRMCSNGSAWAGYSPAAPSSRTKISDFMVGVDSDPNDCWMV